MIIGELAQRLSIDLVLGEEIQKTFEAVLDKPGRNIEHYLSLGFLASWNKITCD
jgi:hypothetical protein